MAKCTPFYLGKSGHVGGLEVTRYEYFYNGEGKDKRGPECRLASPDIDLPWKRSPKYID